MTTFRETVVRFMICPHGYKPEFSFRLLIQLTSMAHLTSLSESSWHGSWLLAVMLRLTAMCLTTEVATVVPTGVGNLCRTLWFALSHWISSWSDAHSEYMVKLLTLHPQLQGMLVGRPQESDIPPVNRFNQNIKVACLAVKKLKLHQHCKTRSAIYYRDFINNCQIKQSYNSNENNSSMFSLLIYSLSDLKL